MLEKILVPDIGEYSDVAIIDIAIKVGDLIKVDAELMTVETDKASMEIPAPKAGIVKELLVKVGNKVSKGSAILMLETVATSSDASPVAPTAPQPEVTPPALPASPVKTAAPVAVKATAPLVMPSQGNAYAGPSVRRYARELGVDLNKVPGSGRKERIVVNDVQQYVQQTLQNGGGAGGLQIAAATAIDFTQFGTIETQPLSRIQKISGTFLHRNWVSIPHVTQFDEANISELELFRQGQKEIAEQKGVKLTPVVFLMKAIVAGLKQFPKFNASLSANGEELILKKYFHVGVAVDTPAGLVVPVIRNVDQKGLFELAADLAQVGKLARDGKLTGANMQGGCFTISSLGGIGGTAFTPIINAPEVAILGVSKSQTKPIYIDGQFVPRLMLPLSLSYDHRVIDGADAVRFTTFIVTLLSDIRRLLL
jgi:Pyruvate/2-oxoglutarate dehydrogenase complex, dihydrolipoamide acyltransferase (E2) component, and related enzymes